MVRHELPEPVVDVSLGGRGADDVAHGSPGVGEVGAGRLCAQLITRVDEIKGDVERVHKGHALERRVRQASERLLESDPLVGRRRG